MRSVVASLLSCTGGNERVNPETFLGQPLGGPIPAVGPPAEQACDVRFEGKYGTKFTCDHKLGDKDFSALWVVMDDKVYEIWGSVDSADCEQLREYVEGKWGKHRRPEKDIKSSKRYPNGAESWILPAGRDVFLFRKDATPYSAEQCWIGYRDRAVLAAARGM